MEDLDRWLTGLRIAMIAVYALLAMRVLLYRTPTVELPAKTRQRGWVYMKIGLLTICAAVIVFYSPADLARIAGVLNSDGVKLAFIGGSGLMILGGIAKIVAWDLADGRSEAGLPWYLAIPAVALAWAWFQ